MDYIHQILKHLDQNTFMIIHQFFDTWAKISFEKTTHHFTKKVILKNVNFWPIFVRIFDRLYLRKYDKLKLSHYLLSREDHFWRKLHLVKSLSAWEKFSINKLLREHQGIKRLWSLFTDLPELGSWVALPTQIWTLANNTTSSSEVVSIEALFNTNVTLLQRSSSLEDCLELFAWFSRSLTPCDSSLLLPGKLTFILK